MSAMVGGPSWTLAVDGTIAAMFDDQLTKRGDRRTGIVDWEMLMATRSVGGGLLQLRGMTSLEPFVDGGSGYPELLQTGGTYRNSFIHDRMHPHDGLMELAAAYRHDVGAGATLSLYAGAVGEPAVGPASYMHRASARDDPFAPLGHHWQDANHQSFGVATIGLSARALTIEGSIFNPREPDETHLIVDYRGAKLDSYSGRITWSAAPPVAVSAWWSYLNSHDRLDPETRMHRYGASMALEKALDAHRRWASTLVWGMNLHHHSGSAHELAHGTPGASPHHHSSSLLAETDVQVSEGTSVFGRAERVEKSGEELGFLGGDLTELYDVRSVSAGITHRLAVTHGIVTALGARGAINVVPETLLATYGTRTPLGFAVYLQFRPRAH